MYFKYSGRFNPKTQKHDWYLRLVESYRNAEDRICHRTLVNVGFPEEPVTAEQLNEIARGLNDRYEPKRSLFKSTDELVIRWTDDLWSKLVEGNKLDLSLYSPTSRKIDPDTMEHRDVREVGAERICVQTWHELGIERVLLENGFTPQQVKLSQTQIISRALYPGSELATSKWIRENSAICELTQYPAEKINKDKLYRNALRLYDIKESLEAHLSVRTNELFDIQDKILLYDLTNTYFEGEKRNSQLAQFGRSKEKRSDAKLVVLAMVVNVFGFIKYSAIHEGNFSDCTDISQVLESLHQHSGSRPSLVVLDAGIATHKNLDIIRRKGFHYLCVNRVKNLNCRPCKGSGPVKHHTRGDKALRLQRVAVEGQSDYYLEVHSPQKQCKEASMKASFEQRLEMELEKIKAAIHKKGGVKKIDKVNRRIGRLAQRFPSAYAYYDIEVKADEAGIIAVDLQWSKNPTKESQRQERMGKYLLRTDMDLESETLVWDAYNTIREIESTFRALKTDLDLRPIYHKNDDATMAHLHLGLLAYWLVNTIRCKLKSKGVTYNWKEIVRIGNTQKIVTTHGWNAAGVEIQVKKCSKPQEKLKDLLAILNLKQRPYAKKSIEKSVVHKLPLKKRGSLENRGSP